MDITHRNLAFVLVLLLPILQFWGDASPLHCPSTNLFLK